MREICQIHLSFFSVLFWTRFYAILFPKPKKLDVTSHPIMTFNGTIILDISFEERSFALKSLLLRLIASSPLIIDPAYVHIITTAVS